MSDVCLSGVEYGDQWGEIGETQREERVRILIVTGCHVIIVTRPLMTWPCVSRSLSDVNRINSDPDTPRYHRHRLVI